jgi:Signal transduction histidine kinase
MVIVIEGPVFNPYFFENYFTPVRTIELYPLFLISKPSLLPQLFYMKNQFALKQLVGHVAQSILPSAVSRHSFFVNDIAPELQVSADRELLASVLSNLLQTAVSQTESDCIRISAYEQQEQVFLQVNENGRCYNTDIFKQMEQLMPMATILGGSVAISPAGSGLELALRFPTES